MSEPETPTGTMPVSGGASATDAFAQAWARMKGALFPFNLDRWLVLGLACFLDQCGRGGGGGIPNAGGNWTGNDFSNLDPSRALQDAMAWVTSHLALVAAAAFAVLLVGALICTLVLWLGSRVAFILVDNVVRLRGDIAAPWRDYAAEALSYFWWRVGLGAIGLFTLLLALFPVALVLPPMVSGQMELVSGILALIATGAVVGLVVIVLQIANVLLRDFVVPIQYRDRVDCRTAWRQFATLSDGHTGTLVVYVLLKGVLALVRVFAAVAAGCCTCCIGFLPVVSQVLLLPLHFAERGWSLHLLQQFGYDVFPAVDEAEPVLPA